MDMRIRHPLDFSDLEISDVQAHVREELGRPVSTASRWPTDTEPGVIIFMDEETGAQIPTTWPVVARAIAKAREIRRRQDAPPRQAPPVARRMLEDFRAAQTDDERWAVVARALSHLAAQETETAKRAVAQWEDTKRRRDEWAARLRRPAT